MKKKTTTLRSTFFLFFLPLILFILNFVYDFREFSLETNNSTIHIHQINTNKFQVVSQKKLKNCWNISKIVSCLEKNIV